MVRFDKIDTLTPSDYSRYLFIDKMLSMIPPEDVACACDVGCGTGNLLAALEGRGIKLSGIDTSRESLDIATAKLGLGAAHLENMDVFDLNEKFDLVFLMDVLEHIEDDAAMLKYLSEKVLRKNGYLIVTVPAHRFLYSGFDSSVGHFRRYNKKAITALLEKNGFKPLVCWGYGSILFYIVANLALFFEKKSPGRADDDFAKRTQRSAIREFSPFLRKFVSRVTILHRAFFLADYVSKNLNIGIGHCVLCKARAG